MDGERGGARTDARRGDRGGADRGPRDRAVDRARFSDRGSRPVRRAALGRSGAAASRAARLRIRSPSNRGPDGPGSRAMAPVSEPRSQLPVRDRVLERNLMQAADIKSVGIIGAGRIGQAMAQIARRAGRQVVIANSRGPQSLRSLVEALGEGVSAGTVEDAAAADVVVLAVMWPDVPQAVEELEWEGRIVIEPT